jgi:metal-responsive CopG/Arc/MetJ family transcriptional regulator
MSISLTDELYFAIEAIAIARRMERSRMIETLLREHPLVKKEIELIMLEPEQGGFAASPKLASTVKQKVTAVSSSGSAIRTRHR